MDKETFFERLPVPVSDEQKKVILAADRATVVNASAGSGKTTTIIIKMLYQINVLGVEPWQSHLVRMLNRIWKNVIES